MSDAKLQKLYQKILQKQCRDTNEMICDMIIGKTSEILETIGWIKSANETSKKLQKKKLFMRDFTNFMSHITPYIPFLGFVEGGISLGEDIAMHTANKVFFPSPKTTSDEMKRKKKRRLLLKKKVVIVFFEKY